MKIGYISIYLLFIFMNLFYALVAAQQNTQQTAQPDEAAELSVTVVKLYKEGKYDEALPLAERALELREKSLGPDHYLVSLALNNLASVYLAKGKYTEAERLFERLLRTYEKKMGPDNPEIGRVLDNLFLIRYGRRDYAKAESLLQRALSIREKSLGSEHIEVVRTITSLANFYYSLGKCSKAESSYRRAVEFMERRPGPVPDNIAKALEKHACLAYPKGGSDEAVELQKRIEKLLSVHKDKAVPAADTGEVLEGKVISKPTPHYPIKAKEARVTGPVVVHIVVDETGRVIEGRALCGHPFLAEAAVAAARQARFTPTLLSGMPVKVTGIITYNFILQ